MKKLVITLAVFALSLLAGASLHAQRRGMMSYPYTINQAERIFEMFSSPAKPIDWNLLNARSLPPTKDSLRLRCGFHMWHFEADTALPIPKDSLKRWLKQEIKFKPLQ